MKKKVFLLLILFLLTGCSCRYDVSINNDQTVNEEVIIYGTNRLYNTYYKTNKVDVLKENLENYIEDLEENNYEYYLKEDTEPYIVIKKKYSNMEDYLNNSHFFNDYFDEISYNEDGNIAKIETIGFNPNEEDNPDRFYVEDLQIDIKSWFEVLNCNTEDIDNKTNTYHFELKENDDNFKIFLNYDLTKKYNPHKKNMKFIIGGIVAIIITWVILYFVNRKKII